jgi:hypothetical protein
MKKLVSSAIMKLEYSFSTNLESETVEELDSGKSLGHTCMKKSNGTPEK